MHRLLRLLLLKYSFSLILIVLTHENHVTFQNLFRKHAIVMKQSNIDETVSEQYELYAANLSQIV